MSASSHDEHPMRSTEPPTPDRNPTAHVMVPCPSTGGRLSPQSSVLITRRYIMPELTGGQALVQSLKQEGITTVFGLPGVQLDWAFDALWEERDAIRVIHPRHEQATASMADGFARTTGKIGTALVVPGPGLLNATAALSTAYACNSPVLMVAGQIQSDLIEVGRGVLHEIPNQLGTIRSVTKWAGRAMTPEEIPGLVHQAFEQLQSGRPRPVEIEIPPDVLQKKADVTLL